MKTIIHHRLVPFLMCGLLATGAHALSLLPTPPLSERVQAAELIFVGTVIERAEEGDWVRAVLRVDEPLHGLKEEQKRVEVIWRTRIHEQDIYDADDGQRGIAILSDKHEGRYWLRADKFEPVAMLDDVKKLIADPPDARVPTFRAWVAGGMKLPEDMMFTGGTPWFDESTGSERTPEAVYEMVFGQPARPQVERPRGGVQREFPAHWGKPPSAQTRDLRPLPGGYGMGSGTLARWIAENLERDARAAD